MLKSLTLRNLTIDLKIFTFKHWLKLETGLSKLKWIESQKYQRDQNPANIASHHQVYLQVHSNQDLQKKKQNYVR